MLFKKITIDKGGQREHYRNMITDGFEERVSKDILSTSLLQRRYSS